MHLEVYLGIYICKGSGGLCIYIYIAREGEHLHSKHVCKASGGQHKWLHKAMQGV